MSPGGRHPVAGPPAVPEAQEGVHDETTKSLSGFGNSLPCTEKTFKMLVENCVPKGPGVAPARPRKGVELRVGWSTQDLQPPGPHVEI